MRTRILLAALVAAGVLSTAAPSRALSNPCKVAATTESGGSNIVGGLGVFTGETTPGTNPAEVPENPLLPNERTVGTLDVTLDLASKACSNLQYTLVASYDAPSSVLGNPEPVEVGRATATGSTRTVTVAVDVDVPGRCVDFVTTSSAGSTVVDRAPNEDQGVNTDCVDDHGAPGSQYWN